MVNGLTSLNSTATIESGISFPLCSLCPLWSILSISLNLLLHSGRRNTPKNDSFIGWVPLLNPPIQDNFQCEILTESPNPPFDWVLECINPKSHDTPLFPFNWTSSHSYPNTGIPKYSGGLKAALLLLISITPIILNISTSPRILRISYGIILV
jgi:hypothetical protein